MSVDPTVKENKRQAFVPDQMLKPSIRHAGAADCDESQPLCLCDVPQGIVRDRCVRKNEIRDLLEGGGLCKLCDLSIRNFPAIEVDLNESAASPQQINDMRQMMRQMMRFQLR